MRHISGFTLSLIRVQCQTKKMREKLSRYPPLDCLHIPVHTIHKKSIVPYVPLRPCTNILYFLYSYFNLKRQNQKSRRKIFFSNFNREEVRRQRLTWSEGNFKGTQAWDNFDFFLPKSKPYMALVNFWKNFNSSPLIFARILMFEHFLGDWAYAEPYFFGELTNIFFANVHFGPIRWVHKRFFKIFTNYSQNLHLNLVPIFE